MGSSRNTSSAQTNNYRTLIRKIIAEETTTEFEGLEMKMDKIYDATHKNSQFVDLMTMISELSDEIKLLRQSVVKNEENEENDDNDDVYEENQRRKRKKSSKSGDQRIQSGVH